MKEIPITSPILFNTGPPLLPGKIGADIWKTLSGDVSVFPLRYARNSSVLPSRVLLIMPPEMVPSNPFGLPTTWTVSPIRTVSLLPRERGDTSKSVTFRIARSFFLSIATIPLILDFSSVPTNFTLPFAVPSITWRQVAIRLGLMKKPLPNPSSFPRLSSVSKITKERRAISAISGGA